MSELSLQEGIDQAGSPMRLKWKTEAPAAIVPVVSPEFSGWDKEQAAWRESAALFEMSHHMSDLFIEGPDSTRMLAVVSVNDYRNFAIGQAKQLIAVTHEGHLVNDGVLLREGAEKYTLTGNPASINWVRYHAQAGGYNVSFSLDPDSRTRGNDTPTLFRFQVQGPRALDVVERAFGGSLPKMKFFHSEMLALDGHPVRALRHGMSGKPGYEFIGQWKDGKAIKEKLLRAGEDFGLAQVGGKAYYTNGIESGWLPRPTPGIFTSPELADYRRFLSLKSPEGQVPLYGSYFSENIEDYYISPYELDYGRLINFDHDFIGRDALQRAKDNCRRVKVTLAFNTEDVRKVMGSDPGYLLRYPRDRVEIGSKLVGMSLYAGHIGPLKTVLSLALIDKEYSAAGTEVSVVWGMHPGPGASADAHEALPRIRAVVHPAPYDAHARTEYRSKALT